MAKRLYDEERIRAIAEKIRQLVPLWHSSKFTTMDMAAAVERVYDEGKSKGRTEGYSNGYSNGYDEGLDLGKKTGYEKGYDKGYEQGKTEGEGVELPTLTNQGTSGDLLAGKELIDSEGNIVVGNIPIKTSNDTIHGDSAITVPSGFYANDVVIDTSSYWDDGYEKGKADCPTYEDGNGVKY